MGALVTDFTLIKPGALHRANGVYLVLDAQKVLMQPLAWEALKRALKTGRIRTASAGPMLSMIRTVSLAPADITMHAKVVRLAEPMLHYLHSPHEPDFPTRFNVAAALRSAERQVGKRW